MSHNDMCCEIIETVWNRIEFKFGLYLNDQLRKLDI